MNELLVCEADATRLKESLQSFVQTSSTMYHPTHVCTVSETEMTRLKESLESIRGESTTECETMKESLEDMRAKLMVSETHASELEEYVDSMRVQLQSFVLDIDRNMPENSFRHVRV